MLLNPQFNLDNYLNISNDSQLNISGIFYTVDTPQYHWLWLIIIQQWILFGNFIVIILILKYQSLFNNNTTRIILSLSVTDFLLSILVLPFTLYLQINNFNWQLGFGPCLLWLASDMQLTTTSILHLCSISFERYLSVAKPIKFRVNMKTRIMYLIVFSWMLSFILCTLPLIIISIYDRSFVLIDDENNLMKCGYFSRIFLAYATLITFWLPLVFMICFGIKTMIFIRKAHNGKIQRQATYINNFNRKKMSSLMSSLMNTNTNPEVSFSLNYTTSNSLQTDFEANSRSSNNLRVIDYLKKITKPKKSIVEADSTTAFQKSISNSAKKEMQAQKTLVIVLIVFVLFYIPLFTYIAITIICDKTCKELFSEYDNMIYYVTTWLGYSSSGINPGLYAFYNKNFTIAFKSLFTCVKINRNSNNNIITNKPANNNNNGARNQLKDN